MTGSIVAFCAYRSRLGGCGGGGNEEEDAKGEVDGAHFGNNVLNEFYRCDSALAIEPRDGDNVDGGGGQVLRTEIEGCSHPLLDRRIPPRYSGSPTKGDEFARDALEYEP
jgi:hypothetical protein